MIKAVFLSIFKEKRDRANAGEVSVRLDDRDRRAKAGTLKSQKERPSPFIGKRRECPAVFCAVFSAKSWFTAVNFIDGSMRGLYTIYQKRPAAAREEERIERSGICTRLSLRNYLCGTEAREPVLDRRGAI